AKAMNAPWFGGPMRLALALVLLVPSFALAEDRSGPLPSLAPLIEQVKGAVVNVDVQSKVNRAHMMPEGMDMFRGRGGPEQLMQGKGSGVIIDGSGLVLTNNHVVQDSVQIRVTLDDGRAFDASIVG